MQRHTKDFERRVQKAVNNKLMKKWKNCSILNDIQGSMKPVLLMERADSRQIFQTNDFIHTRFFLDRHR